MNDPTDIGSRPQDDYVSRRRATPDELPRTAPSGLTLVGLLGDSDRAGYRRLYLNSDLSRYVEFRAADVIDVMDIPADQSPFIGEKATAVTLRPGAQVDFTTSHTADEFDVRWPEYSPAAPAIRSYHYMCRWGEHR